MDAYRSDDVPGPATGPPPGGSEGAQPGPDPGPAPGPAPGTQATQGDSGTQTPGDSGAQPQGLLQHWQAYCTNGHGWVAEWRFEYVQAVLDREDHEHKNPKCIYKAEVREHGSW